MLGVWHCLRPSQVEFLKRWFQAIVPLKAAGRFRTGDDKSEARVVMARENFLLAASYAANTDLSAYFSTLRWPALTADAAALLRELMVCRLHARAQVLACCSVVSLLPTLPHSQADLRH